MKWKDLWLSSSKTLGPGHPPLPKPRCPTGCLESRRETPTPSTSFWATKCWEKVKLLGGLPNLIHLSTPKFSSSRSCSSHHPSHHQTPVNSYQILSERPNSFVVRVSLRYLKMSCHFFWIPLCQLPSKVRLRTSNKYGRESTNPGLSAPIGPPFRPMPIPSLWCNTPISTLFMGSYITRNRIV